jgi:hypothetical protein
MIVTLLSISIDSNENIFKQASSTSQNRASPIAEALVSSADSIISVTNEVVKKQDGTDPAAINNLTLQLLLLFVLLCILAVLFLSIQAFVEYEKFQQLYGDELKFRLIIKNLMKSLFVRFMVFKQMKTLFRKG